jgi:putative ABC transport system permease protein
MKKMGWFIHLVKKSLSQRKSRIIIAASTLLMGTALTTALVGISLGVGEKLGNELRSYGANVVVLPQGQEYLSQSSLSVFTSEFKENVSTYAELLNGRASIKGRDIPVIGTYFAQQKKLNQWWKIRGTWPINEEEVLVGINLAETLKLQPGAEIDISKEGRTMRLKVAGILETGGSEEDALYLEMNKAQQLLGLPGKLSVVMVSVQTEGVPLQGIVRKLQTIIPNSEVKAVRQVAEAENSMLHKVQWLMALVNAAVLIAAAISVMSTMSAMVLERKKEIGLLKALGGTRRGISSLFYAEAMAIGGVAGILGYIAGVAVTQLISYTVFGSLTPVNPILLVLALFTGLGVSLLASYIPVRHALQADPVVSLYGD